MILLNRFIFGDLDKFEEEMRVVYLPDARLSKNIGVFRNCEIFCVYYHDTRLVMHEFYVSFKINHPYTGLNVKFIYEKINIAEDSFVEISFGENGDDDSILCALTTEPLRCYDGNVLLLSDDKSIANIMNILRNEVIKRS